MTIILLNNIIEFDNDNSRLLNKSTGDVINLSLTSSGVLNLLIEHKGDVVSRNEIFDKIFVFNGNNITNNNLNQYISSLRRNIKSLGIEEEFIITVPRVGFMIPRDIITSDIQYEHMEADTTLINYKKKRVIKLITIYGALMCIIISGYLCYFFYKNWEMVINQSNIPHLSPTRIDNIKDCNFNIINSNEKFSVEQFSSVIKKNFPNEILKCSKEDTYYLSTSGIINNRTQQFLLKCKGSIYDTPSCFSVYIHSSGEIK